MIYVLAEVTFSKSLTTILCAITSSDIQCIINCFVIIKKNQKVNLYSASSIKNPQTCHLHISTLKQPCLKSTLELFPGNVTAS